MSELEVLEAIATTAVQRLRTETLTAGQPFMINMNNLPENQCYLEYQDGSIELVNFIKGKNEFSFVKELSESERLCLKQSIGLM